MPRHIGLQALFVGLTCESTKLSKVATKWQQKRKMQTLLQSSKHLCLLSFESGGGGRTRTYDLRIMSCQPDADSKESQQDESADSGKVLQNPHPPRNQERPVPPKESSQDRASDGRQDDGGYPHQA